jgi:hypothetical protein
MGQKKEKFQVLLNSVTVVGFVGADPEQRQARSNGRVSWLAQACRNSLFGAHISSGIFFYCLFALLR